MMHVYLKRILYFIYMLYYAIHMYRHRKVLKDLHLIYFEGIEDMHNTNTQTMK